MVCRILVADDSSTIQKVIRIGLAAIQTEIKSAGSLVEATKIADQGALDLIIADAGLPGISTASDFIKLVERAGSVPLIILMGSYEAVREPDLRAVGITHIIKKPFPPGELPQLVKELTGAGAAVSGSPRASVTPPPPPAIAFPGGFSEGTPSFSLGDEAPSPPDLQQFRPSIPSSALPTFSLGDDGLGLVPPVPEIEPGRKGRPAFESRQPDTAPTKSPTSSSASYGGSPLESFTGSSLGSMGGGTMPTTNAGLSAAVEAFVRDELPALVDRAVERYCAEHFKGVAREVLTAELRRLAEEKARYLVDQ